MKLQIKLADGAKAPTYSNDGDGCVDLCASDKAYDHDEIVYDTGVAINIPMGYVGLLFNRSSVYKTPHLLRNCVGVIDHGYVDTIKCRFLNVSNSPNQYEVGDRIAQLLIIKRPRLEFEIVEEFTNTNDRGGGFGSTGN